jgi:CRISPR-associated protein Csm5
MTSYRFRAMPLTPIHVGSGEFLAPEDYLILKDKLIRFDRTAVLREMKPEQRHEFEAALDRNAFAAAQEILRAAVKLERHTHSRIAISEESRNDLLTLVKNPESPAHDRAVYPFVFNVIEGRPYLPGSSLKGAIRTALVNHFTGQQFTAIAPEVAREKEKRRKWRVLESKALNFEFNRTEADPLHLLKVADAPLPVDSTRLDRALQLQRGGEAVDAQAHYERLFCRGDDAEIAFTVAIEFDQTAASHPHTKWGRQLNMELIRSACNVFYLRRMRAEQRHFFAEDMLPEARYGAQGLIRFQADKLLVIKSIQERGMLLRLGRFSHFESLSVDELREGWNIRKKEPIKDMGSRRMLCRCLSEVRGGRMALPFGWLLLLQE